mgnify:CR=1 FL=1
MQDRLVPIMLKFVKEANFHCCLAVTLSLLIFLLSKGWWVCCVGILPVLYCIAPHEDGKQDVKGIAAVVLAYIFLRFALVLISNAVLAVTHVCVQAFMQLAAFVMPITWFLKFFGIFFASFLASKLPYG